MIVLGLLLFDFIGIMFITTPRYLGMGDIEPVMDIIGVVMMMIPYMGLVMRAHQTSAYYLLDEQRPGFVTAMVSYPDGTTRFFPALRKTAGWLQTLFGYNRDRMTDIDRPLRFPGGYVVYPLRTDMLATNNPVQSEYVSRMKEKYNVTTANEGYCLAMRAFKYLKETGDNPDHTTLETMANEIINSPTEDEKKILDMNRRELQNHWRKHKIGRGVLIETIASQIMDYFALQEYSLDDGMERDMETIVKAERMDERLGKAEMSKFGLNISMGKILLIVGLLALGIFAILMIFKGEVLIDMFKGGF